MLGNSKFPLLLVVRVALTPVACSVRVTLASGTLGPGCIGNAADNVGTNCLRKRARSRNQSQREKKRELKENAMLH
jgi:hypothetical protein